MGVDALATSYPGMNPYNFVMGNPIMAIDPDGDTTDIYDSNTEELIESIIDGPGRNSVLVDKNFYEKYRAENYSNDLWYNESKALRYTQGLMKSAHENNAYYQLIGWYSNISNVMPNVPYVRYNADNGGCGKAARTYCMNGGGNPVYDRAQIAMTSNHGNNNLKFDFSLGVKTINQNLENGRPVMVGVDYKFSKLNNANASTDHFVVIVGRGNDQFGNYFIYIDNVGGFIPRKFYYINGSLHDANSAIQPYTVSEVRPNL